MEYLAFDEARNFVRELGLKSSRGTALRSYRGDAYRITPVFRTLMKLIDAFD